MVDVVGGAVVDGQLQSQVEITVEERTVPADLYLVSAHQSGNCGWIEGGLQRGLIAVAFGAASELCFEAADVHIGDREEVRKFDSPAAFKFRSIRGFQITLLWGQCAAAGVVDQIQTQILVDAVAELVEFLHGRDALLVDAVAPLGIDVVFQIAGERGDQLDALVSQELSGGLLSRDGQHGEIGADLYVITAAS